MATVPFANAPHHLAEIVDSFLLGIQTGNTQGDAGRSEMKYVTAAELRAYMVKYFGHIFNFRSDYDSATPDNPAVNDLFLCSGTFTEGGKTYTEGQFYAYSIEQEWEDVTTGLKGPKGDTGEAAGFGTPSASVDDNVGTPSVEIVATGPDTAKIFSFIFRNLKGVKGDTGEPFAIYRTYASIAEMNADFDNVPEGKFVIIASGTQDPDNAKLYVRGASAFTYITDLSGAQGIQGPQGPQGETGATGNGISSIICRYAVTTTQTQPDPADITGATIPAMSATDKYLWQKAVISYTSGSTETFVTLAAIYGDTGAQGPQGIQGIQGPQGPTGPQGPQGEGVPTGGTTGQILKKKSDTNFDTEWADEQDISGKADKVAGATNGNLAGLDSNGNLTDSGISATDVSDSVGVTEKLEGLETENTELITDKADKVTGATEGNLASLDAQGNLQDSGVTAEAIADIPSIKELTDDLKEIEPETVTVPIYITPAPSATSSGVAGQMAFDSDYLYVCVATDTWKRVALSTY